MNIYKFGGASVRDAQSIKNILNILNSQKNNLIIVVSAMGKMTDALEALCNSYFYKTSDLQQALQHIKDFHFHIIGELFGENNDTVLTKVNALFDNLQAILNTEPSLCYDYEYDRIISFGELLSTTIIGCYLEKQGRKAKFIDIRKCLKTDQNYRNANVDLTLSAQLCQKTFTFQDTFMYITQGFIAGTSTNQTTTLGREGSDYTAALLANLLDAENVTIWKDVPGIMSADPKIYQDTKIISRLSYKEAIELSHCGAKVIHPKTIKPIQNKKIPLYVKSFLHPEAPGSVIREFDEKLKLPPIYIDKNDQLLLTLTPRDFSFIAEEKLSAIFATLAKYRLKLNLMQNSAISFSFCIDHNEAVFQNFINELKAEYEILYNKDARLITIRHYDEDIVRQLTQDKNILVEQRSRLTARFVVSEKEEK
ncbi:aspartate kinase [Odoribacter lunatus]|uniref:aspartate kinase n=1 Tax=Odoribacter lunatus TaxID=2941335 RepID=UPI002041CBA0|nr:aspartate kinase [Odoribacter lunatus]